MSKYGTLSTRVFSLLKYVFDAAVFREHFLFYLACKIQCSSRINIKGGLVMEKEFVEKMKESLLEMKRDLLEQLMDNNADFKQIVEGMESKDVIDIAADDIDRKQIVALGSKTVNKLKLIDNALIRIEQGKYGICMKCGKHIPEARLEAIPYAVMCIECKTSDERHLR